MSVTAKDWRAREKVVYQAQVKDKACTICVFVRRGGKICKECGDARINWKEVSKE